MQVRFGIFQRNTIVSPVKPTSVNRPVLLQPSELAPQMMTQKYVVFLIKDYAAILQAFFYPKPQSKLVLQQQRLNGNVSPKVLEAQKQAFDALRQSTDYKYVVEKNYPLGAEKGLNLANALFTIAKAISPVLPLEQLRQQHFSQFPDFVSAKQPVVFPDDAHRFALGESIRGLHYQADIALNYGQKGPAATQKIKVVPADGVSRFTALQAELEQLHRTPQLQAIEHLPQAVQPKQLYASWHGETATAQTLAEQLFDITNRFSVTA